ncbi:TniQ family protein [Promicromonospora sp. NPDC090134]|uniref:TniQ family protein n=1 Tax=Promicromonospora sp. NPDC090134 TaxID=3364408 RepID=UPI0038092D83
MPREVTPLVPGWARTLPLRVRLAPGEALDSWLLRLAHRNGVPLRRLAPLLGLDDRLRIWRNYALTKDIPAGTLRRIETQTGLVAGTLDLAVLDQFDPLGWTPIPGSRYCPRCLKENGGWWPLRWQLPHTFACLTHRCLLVTVCPACRRTPHSRVSDRSGLAGTTRCTLGATRHARPCYADLLAAPWPELLPDDDPRLAAQAWINTRLDRMGTDRIGVDRISVDRMDLAAVTDLRDLEAVATWLPQRVTLAEVERLGPATSDALSSYRQHNNAQKLHNPAASLVAAAMACHAIDIISLDTTTGPAGTTGQSDRDAADHAADNEDRRTRLAPLIRDVHGKHRDEHRPATRAGGLMILSVKRLTTLSPPLQSTVLHGIDEDLSVTERLRYRTRTCAPRSPDQEPGTVADRARHVPQRLWPDWLIRFLPTRPTRSTDVALTITSALLIPGNPTRNIHVSGELTPWRTGMGHSLSALARSHPDVLTAICNIAAYLDAHHSPIDYRRRRAVFATVDLTNSEWQTLSAAGQTLPGHGARLLHARRHLFTLLTGADLGDPRHPLGLTKHDERTNYQTFGLQMTSTLRTALHDHATGLLAAAGIDEPVTWSPPTSCATGLALPGREPDDIDTAALRQLLADGITSLRAAAALLGVSTHHVRYAIGQLHRPLPQRTVRAPRRPTPTRVRAEQVLTAEFFQREHAEAGKSIVTLAAETRFSSTMISQYAKRAGIRLPVRRVGDRIKNQDAVRGDGIDPNWLREQAGTLRRTNTDIAAELGVNHDTIRKLRKELGIPPLRRGIHSDRLYPTLPAEIRRAVESNRAGWQRLRRFEEVVTHHSISRAAASLGHHHQNLNRQIRRLEADLGAPLLIRGHRYQPLTTTPLGRRVLNHLQLPEVRTLLDTHAPPGAHQHREPYRRNRPPGR